MKNIETFALVDRKSPLYGIWPSGEWDNEPDKVQWADPVTGLPCLIVRNRLGNLCGYAAVTRGHPAFQRAYDTVDVDVHGGLTFDGKCAGKICHVVEPGEEDDVWWLGFDCAHLGDYVPGMGGHMDGEYRNIEYVSRECERLALQLSEMKS